MDVFTLEYALANYIVGQKRTGKNKQFVFIHGDYAIKGPYQQGRFDNVVKRSQIFTIWKTPCVVKMLDYFTVNDGTFIRFPNIMKGYKLESELHTESFSGFSYNILKNAPILDIRQVLPKNPWLPNNVEDLLLALCHCNILGVGDMNLRNTLVDPVKRDFYLIDFDDNLTSDTDTEIFYFNKTPAKVLKWYERVSHLYPRVADRLQVLLTDTIVTEMGLLPRVQRVISLLQRYGKSTRSSVPVPIGSNVPVPIGSSVPVPIGSNVPVPIGSNVPVPIGSNVPVPIGSSVPVPIGSGRKDPSGVYFFSSKKEFMELSNYWVRQDGRPLFCMNGKEYRSSEHAYQSIKFVYEGASLDTLEYSEVIRNSETPNDSKLLGGQKCKGGYQTRMNELIKQYRNRAVVNPNWDRIKIAVMRDVITQKFIQDLHCQRVLVSTVGRSVYEDSPYDSFWGIGKQGTGENWLGRLLVELRSTLPQNILSEPEIVLQSTTSVMSQNIGSMVWKGLRGNSSKTVSGVDFDVAKSALQKYIRRNMPEKAILTAIELYRFGEIGGDPGVSNMYNRLAIIANEDIGVANVPLIIEITRIVESKDRDVVKLAAMVQLMSASFKTRMMSQAWRAYTNPEAKELGSSLGLSIDDNFRDSDIEYIRENINSDIFVIGDPENIKPYVLVFMKRLIDKDFNAYTWAHFVLELTKEMTISKRKKFINGNTRSTTGKADILLWTVLSRVLAPEIHDTLVEAYYNHTESRPFLQNAIMIALYRLPYEKLDLTPLVEIWRQAPILKSMLNGEHKLEIDSFAIDKHTKKGRALGMNVQDFVDEGAVVSPQSEIFHNPILEQIYKTR